MVKNQCFCDTVIFEKSIFLPRIIKKIHIVCVVRVYQITVYSVRNCAGLAGIVQDDALCAKNQKISVCGESKLFLAEGAEKFSRKKFLFFWKARGRPFKMKNNCYIYICNNNNNNKQQSIDIV